MSRRGTVDVTGGADIDFSENDHRQSRATAPHGNEFPSNMAMGYVRIQETLQSRWDLEWKIPRYWSFSVRLDPVLSWR